ncbi:MAG: cysteine synthase family protein [Pseudomonadota bacterium]
MRSETLDSVIGAIGRTPLVRLDRLTSHYGVDGTILAKLDYLNPGGSKKDRAAMGVIQSAKASGALRPGQTVVELTSGNMGTGLAIVCGQMGHPFIAVMSRGNTPERAVMMQALGADVVLVDQAPGSNPGEVSGADLDLVEARTMEIVAERGAFRADQFEHFGNPASHRDGTALEFWEQSGGTITAFADFVGSGGTLAGMSVGLQAFDPSIRCFAVEPHSAAVIAGETVTDPNHPIQGGGYARPDLSFLDGLSLSGTVKITGADAIAVARDLARLEGIFAGYSAGANAAAALELLEGELAGETIGIVICDTGLKYLSTPLFRAPTKDETAS